jgi:hypothetical protein
VNTCLERLVRTGAAYACFAFAAAALGAAAAVSPEDLGIDLNVSYAGDRVVEVPDSGQVITMREHRMPGKSRLEYSEQGQSVVMILDEGAAQAYMLMPEMNFYMTISTGQYQARAGEAVDIQSFEKLGRETIDGRATTRYRVAFTNHDGHSGTGDYWVSDEGIPVRMDMAFDSANKGGERVVMELRNLTVAAQDPALFTIPAGYQSMGSVGDLFGGGDSGAPAPAAAGAAPASGEAATGKADEAEASPTDAAQEAAKETILQGTRESVREGVGNLFNRVRRN